MRGYLTIDEKQYMPLTQAASVLGVSSREVEQLFLERVLPGRRIGNTLYIESLALHAVLARAQLEPMAPQDEVAHPEPRIIAETVRPRASRHLPPARTPQRRTSGVLTTLAAIAVAAIMPIAGVAAYPTMARGIATLRTNGPRAIASMHLTMPHVPSLHLSFGSGRSLGSFFAGVRSQLASVFVLGDAVGNGEVATTTPPLSASKVLAQNALATLNSTSTASTTTSVQPIYYVYNYPVIERIKYEAPGITASSSSDYDAKLQDLYNKIESQILTLSQNTSSQAAQTYQVIAQTNRIDQLSGTNISNATISGGSISGASISGGSFSGTVNASTLSAGSTTLATTTINGDLNLTGSLNFSGSSSTISASAAVLDNATTTTLFSTLAHFSTGIIDTLTATVANITGLTATNSTTTNATSTNLYATNFGSANASTTNLVFTNATGSTMYLSGNATVGGNLTVDGDSITLGTSTANSLVINSAIKSDLIPDQNITRDLGSPSFFWRNAYVGTLSANNISAASTSIGGTASNDFTINSDNATADTEDMNLIFFRGTVVPNALLTWNSTKDRFEFNQPLYIQSASGSTTIPTLRLKGLTGQTGNLIEIASSSGSTVFAVGPDGSLQASGQFSLASASSSLLSVFQKAYFGGTATTTIDSAGNVIVAGNLNVNGSTTLANATSTTFALTGITSSLLKTNGSGSVVAAVAGTDYAPATAGSSVLLGNGAGGFNSYAGTSCTNQFVRSLNGAGVATCATVSLTSDVTGILPIANGGTATSTGGNTNGVTYYNGSYLTNSANLTFNGTNLGIGTTSPYANLSVTSASSPSTFALAAPAGGNTRFDLVNGDGNRYSLQYSGSNTILRLQYNSATVDTFNSNGSLALGGAAAATNMLDVNGAAAIGYTGTTAPANGLLVSGSVGIGTTSPSANLAVQGNGLFSGNLSLAGLTATGTLAVSGTGTSTITGGLQVAGSSGLSVFPNGTVQIGDAAGTPSRALVFVNGTNPSAASMLFGDGTGWQFKIGKRSDNGATNFLTITDNGNTAFNGTITNNSATANTLLYANGSKQESSATVSSATGISFSGGTLSLSAIPNTSLANSTISGVSLGSSLSSVTFSNGGAGGATGSTYNGSGALTVSYNTVGAAPSTTGSNILLGNGSGGFNSYAGTSCTNQFVRSLNGAGVATCATVSLTADVTGILPIANGGTNTSGQTSNGVTYYDGTKITSGTGLTFTGTNLGVGSTTPSGVLAVSGALAPQSGIEFSHSNGTQGLNFGYSGIQKFSNSGANNFLLDSAPSGNILLQTGVTGNVGIGTTTPFRTLSVSNTASAAQAAIAYDGTRYTDEQTDASGDFHINPSGKDVQTDDSNLWVCSGGACPNSAPSGTGNLEVETAAYIGSRMQLYDDGNAHIHSTTGPLWLNATDASAVNINNQNNGNVILTNGTGKVGVGTSTPTNALSVQSLIYVGANGATGMGTATSTFQGDIKITGKLDVGTIDPPYTIDGVKYATYGASTVGVHEEVVLKVTPSAYDSARKLYDYALDFSALPQGSDAWLFYQVTDFGQDWQNLVVTLTPGFDGRAFYEQDPAHHTLHILTDKEGPVSVRMIANRYDFTKWGNLRPDQDGNTVGTHVITSKPTIDQTAAAAQTQ